MTDVKTETPVKVLFVDDERKILGSLRRLMLDEDVQVFTASSGEDGLEVLRNNPEIGVIVSDQRMPGLSGVSFLKQSRKIAPDAYRIVLSGYADMYAAMDAINQGGAWRYMTKPWNDDDMVGAIRQAAQQYQVESENRKRCFSKVCPGKDGETQIDRRGIEGIDGLIDLDAEVFVEIKTACYMDQGLSQVGVNPPIPLFVGIGQCTAGNLGTDAHMVQLVLLGA